MSLVEKVCRLCLGEEPSLHIFDKKLSLCAKIQACCTLQITKSDGLPDQICALCADTLDIVMNFKKQCEENDIVLRNRLNLPNIKVEGVKDEIIFNSEDSQNFDDYFDEYGAHSLLQTSLKEEHTTFDENVSTLSEENQFLKLVSYQGQIRSKSITKKLLNNNSNKIIDASDTKKSQFKNHSDKQCPSCGKIFLKLSSLNKHMSKHSIEKPYKCGICSKDFDYIDKLKEHLLSHNKDHSCEICGRKFKKYYDIRRHLQVVHNKSTDIGYRCYNTSIQHDNSQGVNLNTQTDIDDTALCSSPIENESNTVDITQLNDERSEDDNSQNILRKKFALIGSISDGTSKKGKLRNRTPRTKSTLCPFCGKLFLNWTSMTKHMRTHTETIAEKPHICILCSKKFRYERQLKDHIKAHEGTREYPCDTCDKMFKTQYDARRHSDIVHKRKRMAQCKVCGDKLATSSGLKKHLLIHTGEKPYECDFCQQQFTFKNSLIFHIRTHTGEKPYMCKYCDSRFSLLRSLTDHERLHTGETPYHCPVCTKGFTQLSNMKSHFRNNHKGVEFKYQFKGSKKFKEGHMSKL